MGFWFVNDEVSEVEGGRAVEPEDILAVQACWTSSFCASILSGRFAHFSGAELGDRFRFSLSSMSETAMESRLPVGPPGPSFSVSPRPGSGADNHLLLFLCSDRNFFTCKDRENLLGMEVGDPE